MNVHIHTIQPIIQEEQNTLHHGRPGMSAKRKQTWAKTLSRDTSSQEWELLIAELVYAESISTREIGAILLGDAKSDWTLFTKHALSLATDNDWEVREWVVKPLVTWWIRDKESTSALFTAWLALSGRPRRAVIVAVLALLNKGEWSCEDALKVVDQVIDDPDPYVIANVGSFLIGDGLLRKCPEMTIEALRRCLARVPLPDAIVKNVKGVLKSKAAKQYREKLERIWIEIKRDS